MPELHALPEQALIHAKLPGAWFADCHSITIVYSGQSVLGLFLKLASQTPGWVNALMLIRNKLVSLVGLKDLGLLSELQKGRAEADYQQGERVGIFTLLHNIHNEVLLTDQDKHLDVILSLHIKVEGQQARLFATTVVNVHNRLGQLYMLPVRPIHRLIVPHSLKTLANTIA